MSTALVVNPDVITSHLQGEAVLLHMGTKSYYRLNGTGAHVWKCIEQGTEESAIIQSLMEEFDVSRADAEGGFKVLCDALVANSLVSVSGSIASHSDA